MPREIAPIIAGPKRVDLSEYDAGDTAGLKKEQGLKLLAELGEKLAELTNLLAYAGDHALLVVLQGRDASGKDGAIRKLLEYGNVLAAHVVPFKAPSTEERQHDFLWRVHRNAPRKGEIALFNRSHYEDVIAARVHRLVPKEVWEPRYEAINDFEKHLVEEGTIIVKFCLNVSKGEQRKRLMEREQDPRTAWKLNVGDWKEIPHWDETTAAYEDALARCSSKRLPFHLVPSDHKWFRNVVVFQRIIEALEPYRKGWLAKLAEMRKTALAEIEPIRKSLEKAKKR